MRRRLLPLCSLAAVLAPRRPLAAGTRLRIGGTGMALAAMRQVGAAFMAASPGLLIEVLPSLGTSGGLAAVAAGPIDLALLARGLSPAEQARGLNARAYGRTSIAFVTHAQTAATGISMAEVASVLQGGMTAWPDGAALRLVRREPSDADWNTLRRLSPAMAQAVEAALKRPGLLTVSTDQENAEVLQRLPGSFGTMAVGQLLAEALQLKPLALDGIPPDPEALAAGRYPLSRTLHAAWSRTPSPPLAAFLDFLAGAEAQALLRRLGHLPPAAG